MSNVDSVRSYFHQTDYYALSDILITHLNTDNRTVSITVEFSTIAKNPLTIFYEVPLNHD